jgi:exodeoxyribonuclease VII large subunit
LVKRSQVFEDSRIHGSTGVKSVSIIGEKVPVTFSPKSFEFWRGSGYNTKIVLERLKKFRPGNPPTQLGFRNGSRGDLIYEGSQTLNESETGNRIYTVSELTQEIRDLLEEEFPLVWVEGEISNFRIPPSGHYYFSLKDAASQIRIVFFKSSQGSLSFIPEDGLHVLCLGRLSVYAGRGEYQIVLERMELKGWGALQLAFEKLKQRLLEEGLFDEARKKPIPELPRRVAVVTSPSGAAIRDFLRVLYRRFRNIQVSIFPVLVQGEKASFEIAQALSLLNQSSLGIEVIVLTRGGGSLEDLWAFNEERVARAIAASDIPVISAIGHEVDFTIADFVADLRASTPSAAAELLIRPQAEWEEEIEDLLNRLAYRWQETQRFRWEKLHHIQKRLGDPRRRLADLAQRLDDLSDRLRRGLIIHQKTRADDLRWLRERLLGNSPLSQMQKNRGHLDLILTRLRHLMVQRINQARLELESHRRALQGLGPWNVLERGYAFTQTLPGLKLIKDVEGVRGGQAIRVTLARGEMDCRVEETRKKEDRNFVKGTV